MEGLDASLAASIVDSLVTTLDLRRLLAIAAEQLGQALEADRSIALLYSDDGSIKQPPIEWSAAESDPQLDGELLSFARSIQRLALPLPRAISVHRPAEDPVFHAAASSIKALGVASLLAVTTRFHGIPNGTLILYRGASGRVWQEEELRLLEYVAHFFGIAAGNCLSQRVDAPAAAGRAIGGESLCAAAHFDSAGRVLRLNSSFAALTGITAQQAAGRRYQELIEQCVHEQDRRSLLRALDESVAYRTPAPALEFRLVHAQSGATSKAVCQFGPAPEVPGFELTVILLPAAAEGMLPLGPADQYSSEEHYRRLVDNSDAVIFHVDAEHAIRFISNRALELFGVEPQDVAAGTVVRWYDLVHLEDRERVKQRALDERQSGGGFEEECRVVNHLTGKERWLLTKFVPVQDKRGALCGWDGFAVDITTRREAQEALDAQSKKVRALYTVSSAIRGYLDPANIASRGLAALCEATGADAGLCYLYPSRESDRLALVAHHGFSVNCAQKSEVISSVETLSTYVAEHGQSVVVPDMKSDPRCSKVLAEEEGLRSTALVPISVEEETLGTLALFHRHIGQFDGGDVMLVAAAANQIGLAARQASLFAAYRKQTRKLAALYRISHELSGFLSLDDVFQRAFTIIRDELGLRRLWLGLLNETGTRIIGTAAYGPGWKKRLVEMNMEITGREHPIAQVVTTRKAMIIEDPERSLSRFGVRRFFSRYSINSVGLVPLVSGGQVLGVLAFQAENEETKLDEEQLTLISSLAAEIAANVLAKRLEERIAQGEKMRAAGLLAAGIAHNFNNLLQAILGQASLLEMQFPQEEKVRRPARTIHESATKGASLVKQLVSFANLEEPKSEVCDVNAVIERGVESLNRNIKERHQIVLRLGENLPRALVDPDQLMRILITLVRNASDAMERGGPIILFSDSTTVDRESPHYEVPYGTYLRVGVRDEGVGMDPETRRRCFEPFFTTKNLDPNSGLGLTGAGLGLAAAYALARKNGGRLVADSRKGHGSVFTLYLPVYEQEEADAAEEELERKDAAGNGATDSLHVEVERMPEKAKDKQPRGRDSRPGPAPSNSRGAEKPPINE